MNRLSTLFLILMAGVSACKQPVKKEVVDPDVGYRTIYTIDPKSGIYDGPYEKTDSAGALLERGIMKAGKQNGVRELYFADGTVKVRERYREGQIDDLYENFYPNGKLQLAGYYVRGEMYGLWKNYDTAGRVLEEVMMIHNEENGPFREYYADGTIQAEGAYLHGPNEEGTLKLYDEKGTLYKSMLCQGGRCYTTWQRE